MPGIGPLIREIDVNILEIWESKQTFPPVKPGPVLTLTLTANGTYDKAFFLIEREAYITIPSVIIGVRLGFNGLL